MPFGRIHSFSRTKIDIQKLAQTSPIRQLFAPFSAEGGIRLPRYRVIRQQAKFAQAHWVLSIVSIECDAVGLALVKECRDCHFSGCSEKVCELRVGLCPIIAGVNGTDGMEELSPSLSKIRQRHADFNPVAISVGEVDSSFYTTSVRRATLSSVVSGVAFQVRCPIATVILVELDFGLVAASIIRNGSALSLIYGSES